MSLSMISPLSAGHSSFRLPVSRISRTGGFTLVEILAATAIMVLITFFILSMTTNVLTGWSASKSALSANYEAKIALDKMAQDIESAIFRRNGNEWFVIESVPAEDVPGSLRLMFYASVPDRAYDESDTAGNPRRSPSDVCAVNYRLRFLNLFNPSRTGQGERHFALYRTVASPRDTFNVALAQSSPRSYWALPAVHAGSALTQHLLSRDIAAIGIDAAYLDSTGERQVAENIQQLVIGDTITIVPTGGGTINDATRVLYLDISIGALGDEGALAFHYDTDLPGGALAGGATPTVDRINQAVERYGKWYTRRVVIRSTPL